MFKIVSLLAFSLVGVSAYGVPTLQLGIGGGEYDLLTETVVSTDNLFTLFAYGKATGGKAIDVTESHYISIALTPQTGPVPEPFGSFQFNGTTYDVDNMDYGNPPFEAVLDHEPGDLAPHSVFNTFFLELEFLFSASMTTATVNTQDSPDHVPTGLGGDLYYQSFDLDVSNLLPGFGLHFDLYNSEFIAGDVDIDNFAPFSHDAGTAEPVPEPTTISLLALSLLTIAGLARRRRRPVVTVTGSTGSDARL
ncbi:MAG: choice-of-anchor N protein [Gammaproteobacteria bacterium]|nr:choice-of-anchor N protein [Gammaproteobacteria bacterium]